QIVLNNTLAHYGALSIYGSDIPLACAGIISKVNMIFMSFVIGISQGVQPIIGFNYGAALYRRVKKSYLLALAVATGLSLAAFACFQLFPRQIISIFGTGSEMYYQFSERYFRIYMFLTLINGIQPVTSNFFNSIGKARLGVFMSLTRQILFLLPLIVIFPLFMGIDGVMYAGPIADGAAAIVCGFFTVRELRELTRLQQKTEKTN
ncbi:MATE family efflux transporter, partial [Gemmiger sp.]